MHAENSILIKAPLDKIFETAADLSQWPTILPHYRWIRFIEQTQDKAVVRMAAFRNLPSLGSARIPVQWTSEFIVDRSKKEIRFHHLAAFTKGMDVVWSFTSTREGVMVKILHDLEPSFPVFGRLITENIIGDFFVSFIAGQTLRHMKQFAERTYGT